MIRKLYEFMAKYDRNRTERLIFMGSLLLLLLFLFLQAAARWQNGFAEWYSSYIYPIFVGTVGRFFGLFPFSFAEIFLYMVLFFLFLYGIFHLKQWKKLLNRTFFLVSLFLFLFTVNCGINYYRKPFSQFTGYRTRSSTTKELEDLLGELTLQVNLAESQRTGEMVEIGHESVEAMKKLGIQHSVLAGFYPQPKGLMFSRLLSVQQLAGIYSPFTIEANYNREMIAYNIPHTVCHELSHLRGFMREDEANFIGFLACIGSGNVEFRYSGYLTAWIYAGNALAADNKARYGIYWNSLNENVKQDLLENSAFWDRFDTKAAKVSEAVNDVYLKMNSQSDGVKSYGRVVDLLLAWYRE